MRCLPTYATLLLTSLSHITFAQDAEAPAVDAPVTPGRAYNDPREVRKRQKAAEEAKKAGSN